MSSAPQAALQAAIDALQAQRPALGNAIVDQALAPLLQQMAQQQAAPTSAAQQLRQAHILFLDIVGSTAASQRFDPESLHQLMDDAMQRFSGVVRSHGGQVLQYAGDSLLAVWGSGVAHEDDAERAVCGGLALIEAARDQARHVSLAYSHDGFAVRVGIHTGPVLLGGGVAGEGNIRGQAVNVAARMEQSAPPFGLRISHDTQRLVRGLFDMAAQPPLAVKGIDLPVVTWLVQRQRPATLQDPRRGIEGVGACMVGRDSELAQLLATWSAARARQQVALMWLDGDAGVGKSRLRAEFERELAVTAAPPRVLGARCAPQGALRAWGLLRDLLFHSLGVADGADAQAARHALTQACAAVGPSLPGAEAPATAAALLGQLLGLPCEDEPAVAALAQDGRQLRQRALAVAVALLRKAAEAQPLLLLAEDVHWADPPSVGFLSSLPHLLDGCAVGVLMLSRPLPHVLTGDEGTEGARVLRAARAGATLVLSLAPLGPGAAGALADALLAPVRDAPAALRALLVERADGNPFYMEELLQMLMDRGTLVPEPPGDDGAPRWRLAGDAPSALQVPPSLVGVLQARLDALPAAERDALLRASVVGALFWTDALAALQPGAPAALPALARRELTLPQGSSVFDNTEEWAFRHHLLHQVTYDNVLRAEKQAWHRQVAAWVEQRAGTRQGEVLGLIAEHLEHGGQPEPAAAFWVRAAQAALARDAQAEALEWAARAEALDARAAPPSEGQAPRAEPLRRRFAIAALRDLAAEKRSDQAAQQQAIDDQQITADALDDPALRARALLRRAWLLVGRGRHAEGQAAAEAAIAMVDDPATQARAHAVAMAACFYQSLHAAAREHAERGLQCARSAGDGPAEANLLNSLAVVHSGSDLPRTIGLLEQSVARHRADGGRWSMSLPMGNLGLFRLEMGLLAESEDALREALQLAHEAGNLPSQARGHANLARALAEQGRLDEALDAAQRARRIGQDCGLRDTHALGLHTWALVMRLRGEHAAAREAALESTALYRAGGQHGQSVGPAGEALRAALALGQLDTVRDEVQLIHDAVEGSDGFTEPWAAWYGWLGLRALGDPGATPRLALAHELLLKNAEIVPAGPARERWLQGQADRRQIQQDFQAHGHRDPQDAAQAPTSG